MMKSFKLKEIKCSKCYVKCAADADAVEDVKDGCEHQKCGMVITWDLVSRLDRELRERNEKQVPALLKPLVKEQKILEDKEFMQTLKEKLEIINQGVDSTWTRRLLLQLAGPDNEIKEKLIKGPISTWEVISFMTEHPTWTSWEIGNCFREGSNEVPYEKESDVSFKDCVRNFVTTGTASNDVKKVEKTDGTIEYEVEDPLVIFVSKKGAVELR